jgi:hypothetical protein
MDDRSISRKEVLAAIVMLPAFAALATTATQAAGASKASVKYQTTPKDGRACAGCKFFTSGKPKTAAGKCSVVAGSISPTGWCVAWDAK